MNDDFYLVSTAPMPFKWSYRTHCDQHRTSTNNPSKGEGGDVLRMEGRVRCASFGHEHATEDGRNRNTQRPHDVSGDYVRSNEYML